MSNYKAQIGDIVKIQGLGCQQVVAGLLPNGSLVVHLYLPPDRLDAMKKDYPGWDGNPYIYTARYDGPIKLVRRP